MPGSEAVSVDGEDEAVEFVDGATGGSAAAVPAATMAEGGDGAGVEVKTIDAAADDDEEEDEAIGECNAPGDGDGTEAEHALGCGDVGRSGSGSATVGAVMVVPDVIGASTETA